MKKNSEVRIQESEFRSQNSRVRIQESEFKSQNCLVPSLRLGTPILEAPPLLLAAEPPGAAFPAGGWKRDLKRVLA
ncbi:hypothetical protein [Nostoc sp.]|uniref:hypothetical protein n=1 Tax=Nostoc sp. TaxID=1180 RepID=UPI002FF9686E